MEAFFNSQVGIFVLYLLAGVVICLLYDIFRALRRTVKTSDFGTYIEDIIFWILVAIFLIYLIFVINSGKIRFFMFAAIGLGGIAYYFTLSNYFIKFSIHILTCIKVIIKKIITLLLIPLKLFLKVNKKVKCIICINLKNFWKNLIQKSKIGNNKIKKYKNVKEGKKQNKFKNIVNLEKNDIK